MAGEAGMALAKRAMTRIRRVPVNASCGHNALRGAGRLS
jgi:hypothetical protein